VFAIPGSIHSPQARGCHVLLREGAKLVETAQDVLEELRPLAERIAPPRKGQACEDESQESASADQALASSHEDPLLAVLGHDPVGLDALVARTGIAPSHLQARLLELELAGEVARLPGGLYQRVVAA
jgi:DNA processing protein